MIGKCNPLNIRTSSHFNWNGQDGATRGFCNFESVTLCRRAGAYLLMRSYRRAGVVTIAQIIERWAPPSENLTYAYIDFVSNRAGLSKNIPLLLDSDYCAVLAAMEIFEQGIPAKERESYFYNAIASYRTIINQFNIKRYEA